MKSIRIIIATASTAAISLVAVPAHAVESDPHAYSSQPHTVCGAVYANDVDGWSYTIDGKPFSGREERRVVEQYPNGTQSEVVATNDSTGESRTFWLTVNPCIDWEATARENAQREQNALADVAMWKDVAYDLRGRISDQREQIAHMRAKIRELRHR